MDSIMHSLERLSLNVIVQNFERFYVAFTLSKMERNFKFLQRKYSAELASELYDESGYTDKSLKEEYLEFLLNENLNILQDKWLKKSRYFNSKEDIFCRLPNLTEVKFSECGDEVLENIAKFCPKMIEIDLEHSSVTDNGVKYLCETKNGMLPCPGLKNVFFDSSCVTEKGVKCLLRNLPSLEKINYPNVPLLIYSIYKENLTGSENIQSYNLVELSFLGDRRNLEFQSLLHYSDVLKTCAAVCPKLQSLSCYIPSEGQLIKFNNSHLEKLHLEALIKGGSYNINGFLKLNGHNLTSLKISDCTLSLSVLGTHCPTLEEFDSMRVNFTHDDDLKLEFASLTECKFRCMDHPFINEVCLLLSSSPKLETISFHSCDIFLENSQILGWRKNLSAKNIFIAKSGLEVKFLREILLNCPSLELLFTYKCSFFNFNSRTYDAWDILQPLAESLPNKPDITL